MSTLSEIYFAKIRNLQNIVAHLEEVCGGGSGLNYPSTSEILASVKYFKNLLIGILKDASEVFEKHSRAGSFTSSVDRRANYIAYYNLPTLDYFTLFDGLVSLMEMILKANLAQNEMAAETMECLCVAMIFVDSNVRVDLPMTVAGMLFDCGHRNLTVQSCIMNALCRTIIPICFDIGDDDDMNSLYCADTIPSLITLVLEYAADACFHFQLIETLMMFKQDLWSDLMFMISCGDGVSQIYATQLLFHYWPHLHPSLKKEHRLTNSQLSRTIRCQNTICSSILNTNFAVTMVLDPPLAARCSGKSPPLYLCRACSQEIISDELLHKSLEVILPADAVGHRCGNSHCLSEDPVATVTLLGGKSRHGEGNVTVDEYSKYISLQLVENQLMRCCMECWSNFKHITQHLNLQVQMPPLPTWHEEQARHRQTIVDTVVCLLIKRDNNFPQTTCCDLSSCKDSVNELNSSNIYGVYPCTGCAENMGLQLSPKTLSHFGVWLLVSLCPPEVNFEYGSATQLIAAVFCWYQNNSQLTSDAFGNMLEDLKPRYLESWLHGMHERHFKAFVSCLLPHPTPECRVRGHWDDLKPLWCHYQHGLQLITCLSSYSIISAQVWDCIIPCWLAAICENISAIDLEKLEKILNALFDKDLSPLPFKVRKMFDFIFHKFKQVDMNERENALEWLQILSEAGVYISVESLLEMFSIAESNLSSPGCADNVDIMTSQVGREWSKDGRAAKLSEKELKEMMKNSQNKSMRTLQDALEAMNVICTGPSQGKKCEGATTFHGNVNENKRKTSQNNSRTSRIINSSSFFKTKRLSSRYRRRNSVVEQKEGEVVKPSGKKRPAMNLPTPDVKQFTGNSVKLTPELNACRRIACYVDMLDIIHKQLLLQNCLKNEGLGVEESLQVASLCNKLLTHLLEMNQRHDLSDDDLYRKMELQQTNCLFSAILDLLHFILPSNQQKVPENKVDSDWANSPSLFNVSGRKNKALKTDDFDDYVLPVRIIYHLAMLLTCYEEDYAITLKIIGSISLLCFSKNVLDVMSKIDDQVMRIFEAEIFLPSMWRQLKLRHSDLSSQVALVLLHCVNILPGSFKTLMDLFDSPFHAKRNWAHGDVTIEDWSPQFVVVDQIHTILLNVDKSFVDERTPLTYVVSYALCLILAASSQPNTALHTKARFVIKSLSTKNLENAYTCLKHEYDKSVLDRTFILSQFLLLHQLRPDSSALSFHNFTHFMDVLAIDATLYNLLGIPFPFPAAACSQKLPPEAKKQRVSHQVAGYKGGTGATFAERIQKAHLDVEISSLKTMSGTTINSEHKTVDDSLSSSEVENEVDHEIVNHLMFIITKYMIGCENDVKSEDKRKDFRTFLRQIYAWLNYNEVVGYFACPPSVLRSVAGINTFLLNLPQILDHNQTLGNLLLPMVLALLDMVSKSSDASSVETQCAVCHMCALDHLVEPIKIAWLSTIRIIMYKYELNEQSQQKQLLHLIQISMEVLEGEFHICGMGPVKGHDVEERAEKCQSTDLRSNPSTPAPPKPSAVQIPSSILEKNVFSVESKGGSSRYPASPLSQTSELDSKEDRPLLIHHREVGKSTYDNDPSDDETGSSEESQPGKDSPESHLQTTAPCQSKKKPLAKKEKEIIKTSSPQARCTKCNEIIKEYSYETLSHCVINLCHFVRFDPILGVPLLPRMLALFAYIGEPLLGGVKPTPVMFMAKQSMRCLLHQFAENHVFIRLFLIPFRADSKFIPVVAACLKGYQKLQYIDVLELVLQGLPEDLCELTSQDLSCLLSNLATFLHQVPAETSSPWQQVLGNFCAFFTKLHNFIANKGLFSADSLLDVMTSLLKSPATAQFKQSLLEPFSKLLSTSVTCCVFSVQQLFNLCSITNEMFNKEKDKLYLTRCVVSKLVSALKMNTNMTGQNLLLLLQMVLLDGGSTIAPFTISKLNKHLACASVEGKVSCCAMECMNPHIGECLDILADDGFLSKIKSCSLSRSHDYHSDDVFKGLLEDEIKLSLAQLVAGQLQEKPLNNYFPCLYHPPSVVQLGPKEYNECVSHLKKLSWVLLGSLSHLALQQGSVENIWKPVCSDLGLNLATIVQVVLTGYLAQNKEPKVEMTSLFYAFIACQLWTVYCEQLSYYVPPTNPMTSACSYNPIGDDHVTEMSLLEFWSSVTPSILVLLEQDGQVSSNIRRHMLSLIQGLDKYESSLLFKLYPMWSQMLDPRPMNESILSIEREEKFQQFRQSDVIDSSRGARWNGERVLDIVLSINNKLIKLENDEGLCVV